MKKCCKCKGVYHTSHFYRNRNASDGLYHMCKVCWNKYMSNRRRVLGMTKLEKELQVSCITFLSPANQKRHEKFVREYVENLGKNML